MINKINDSNNSIGCVICRNELISNLWGLIIKLIFECDQTFSNLVRG